MAQFERIKPALVLNRVPKNGEASSEDFNDFMEQTIHDTALAINTLNNKVLPILDGLGAPGTYSDIDVVADGLDGTTLILDKDWTDITSPYYWHTGSSRPKTVSEAITQVVDDLDQLYSQINVVKARLGTTDQEDISNSNPATLAELETKVNNLTGIVFGIQSDNSEYLTAAEIATAINDQTINPASFHITDGDVEATAGIAATKISGVDLTTSYAYSGVTFPPASFDMRDSVLRLKEWIEDITGETFATWGDDNVTSGTTRAHIESVGAGTVTSSNPHGLDVSDLSDTNNLLEKPQIVAEFEMHVSGNSSYEGGYSYIPDSYDLTTFAVTLGIPGSTGKTVQLWRRRSGSNTLLASGLAVGTSPTPGSATAALAGASVEAGDLLFVSGTAGDGLNVRAFVFGK